jgi:tripartite-type tricarboxylate transporter receptor subunit TctC
MEIVLWTGLVAPVGTPNEIVDRLQDAVADTIGMPTVDSALDAISVDGRATTSAEFSEIIKRDTARWKAVAEKANIKLD